MKDFLIHKQGSTKIKLQVKESDDTNPLANKFYWQYIAYNERKEKNRRLQLNRKKRALIHSEVSRSVLEFG